MLPENLTITHIATVMKRSPEEVLRLAEFPRIAYFCPAMRPVAGKMRLITAPRGKWKMPYQWLGIFLRREFKVHPAAHGSVPGKSPFTAAARHIGPRNLLSRDVEKAFPNVKSDRFYLEMLAFGFEPEVARLLTKLLLPDGYIPQGGPASNAAIDLFFSRIDGDTERELSSLHARYTRFTDGLDASFINAAHKSEVAAVIERNLARLGLQINAKKLEKNGWQPIGSERVICGVRVNSSRGTQLPRKVLKQLFAQCESLYRGTATLAPHTLLGLGRRRRSLQGWLNQACQADISPIKFLQRRLKQADVLVLTALKKQGINPNRQWYTKGYDFDTPRELSVQWHNRRKATTMLAA
jgi:hypothetical protein